MGLFLLEQVGVSFFGGCGLVYLGSCGFGLGLGTSGLGPIQWVKAWDRLGSLGMTCAWPREINEGRELQVMGSRSYASLWSELKS